MPGVRWRDPATGEYAAGGLPVAGDTVAAHPDHGDTEEIRSLVPGVGQGTDDTGRAGHHGCYEI